MKTDNSSVPSWRPWRGVLGAALCCLAVASPFVGRSSSPANPLVNPAGLPSLSVELAPVYVADDPLASTATTDPKPVPPPPGPALSHATVRTRYSDAPKGYRGSGSVTLAVSRLDHVRLWADEAKTKPLSLTFTVTPDNPDKEFWIEGRIHSDTLNDLRFEAKWTAGDDLKQTDPTAIRSVEASGATSVLEVDCDIDSLNQNGATSSLRALAVDIAEKNPDELGKIILPNGDPGPSLQPGKFTPMVLELKAPFTPARAKFGLQYGSGMRVWRTQAATRNPAPFPTGDLIASSGAGDAEPIPPSLDWSKLSTTSQAVVYIEYFDTKEYGLRDITFTASEPTKVLKDDAPMPCTALTFDRTRAWLMPVELVDLKVPDNQQDDLIVASKTPSSEGSDSFISWIWPHDGPNDGPEMPRLVLRIKGDAAAGIQVKWKLEVKYDRPRGDQANVQTLQGEDEVYVPARGVAHLDQGWKMEVVGKAAEIYKNPDWKNALDTNGVFGGEAKLRAVYSRQNGEQMGPELEILFAIRGKNPEPDKVKAFTDASSAEADARLARLSYAVGRHESKDYNGEGSRYNQFWANSGSRFRAEHRKGDPLWCKSPSESSAGGIGMFQITGNATNGKYFTVPRSVLWDWQANVRAYLGIVKLEGLGKAIDADPTKNGSQVRFFNLVRALYGDRFEEPPMMFLYNGVQLDAWEMGVITLYNGAAGCPTTSAKLPNGKTKKMVNPWKYNPTADPGEKWSYHPNVNNYLHEVLNQR